MNIHKDFFGRLPRVLISLSTESLHGEFGNGFDLVDSTNEIYQTPFGMEQKFIYCYCRLH